MRTVPPYSEPPSPRPSDARRTRLKQLEAEHNPVSPSRISSHVSIERYYEMANKLLEQFQSSYTRKNLDDAYIFGRRFVTFSTMIVPKHDYYLNKRPKWITLREKSVQDSNRVLELLEEVATFMDIEEEEKINKRIIETTQNDFDFPMVPEQNPLSESTISYPLEEKTTTELVPIPFLPSNWRMDPNEYLDSFEEKDTHSSPLLRSMFDSTNQPDHGMSIQTWTEIYTDEYLSLLQSHSVEWTFLSTYQGSKSSQLGKDSTNGCTVISPLIVACHLSNTQSSSMGILDEDIESIIDDMAPDVLATVRTKLGLASNALIIPSDVNDCLLELEILQQDQFVGVVGGNILDHGHVQKFLHILEDPIRFDLSSYSSSELDKRTNISKTRKVASSFFFHEHVISILKVFVQEEDSSIRYDIVDSMPHPKQDGNLGAVRIRCMDLKAVEVFLRWRACDAFTEKDQTFVNKYNWNDSMCDYDPRVFQAYIWKE